MALTVPSTDTVNYQLQAQITSVAALVSANANPAVLAANQALLDSLRIQLVMNLMSNYLHQRPGGSGQASNDVPAFLNAATILTNETVNT